MPQTRCRHVTWRSSWFVGRLQVISGQRRPFLTWHVRALLSCFSVVLVPFMPPSLLGGSWDAFQIPHGPSYQARSLLPDWFSHDPRAPPCYQGDAAVTCQFRDAHRLLVAQNRIVKSFRCKARERERVAPSPRQCEQSSGRVSQLHANLVHNYVCLELTGRCCSGEWLHRDPLVHFVLVRPPSAALSCFVFFSGYVHWLPFWTFMYHF